MAVRCAIRAIVWSVFAVCAAIGVRAEALPSQGVLIRLYRTARPSAPQLSAARRVADRILRAAGVQVGWRECASDGPSSERCADILGPLELVVRLVGAPTRSGASETLGFSYIDTATARGTLATVFADRVMLAAERVRGDVATLLGRAIAHEIGHLLLGTTAHTTDGLMRARWPDAWLADRLDGPRWRFSSIEAASMRQLLVERATPPSALALARVVPAPIIQKTQD